MSILRLMSLRSASCRAIRTQLLWQCTSSAFKGKGEVLAHGPPLSRQFSKKSKQKAPTDLVFVDYFCGIGMFACALHQNGYRCLGAFDCDRRAASIYQANFPDTKVHVADIRKVPKKIIPKRKTGMFMIWPVGFPWSVPPALAHLKPPSTATAGTMSRCTQGGAISHWANICSPVFDQYKFLTGRKTRQRPPGTKASVPRAGLSASSAAAPTPSDYPFRKCS